jgi:hypothetical protein
VKIFIVMGETGEYSDRNEWIVSAHYVEQNAIDLRHRLNVAFRCISPQWLAVYWNYESEIQNHMKLDSNFSLGSNREVRYFITATELT